MEDRLYMSMSGCLARKSERMGYHRVIIKPQTSEADEAYQR